MAIDANTVKQLRDKTGAGMMDCKNALTESNGDLDAAMIFLENLVLLKQKKRFKETKRGSSLFLYSCRW